MQLLWDRRLASEGLGALDFAHGRMTGSVAGHHEERTTDARPHTRDADILERLSDVLAVHKLPARDRLVLARYVSGAGLRTSAQSVGISKDTAHRIVLRYAGNFERATMAELAPREVTIAVDPRRADPNLSQRSRADASKPHTHSDIAATYFKLAAEWLESVCETLVAQDLELWILHSAGQSRREIARRMRVPQGTVYRAIERMRIPFKAWLKESIADRKTTQREEIEALFAAYEKPQEPA